MPLNINDNNLDPILLQKKTNRDEEVPEDILISSYSNLVDKGRKTIKRSVVMGGTVTAGLANKAHSVVDTVNKAIQENRILTSSVKDYIEIYSENYIKVYAKFIGTAPTVTTSGAFSENINITASNIILEGVVIRGRLEDTNEGIKQITFRGTGIPGNTSHMDIIVPSITKLASTSPEFGLPSETNPYSIDLDNNASIDVVGIGNTALPSITLKLQNLNYPFHFIKFGWS